MALSIAAVLNAEQRTSHWHIAGSVSLPVVILVAALGWRITWPHRFVRATYTVAITLLVFANLMTFYSRTHARLLVARVGER